MKHLELIERLTELDRMISAGRAISPSSMAKKFNTTSRSVITWINLLKDLGAPVYYCRRTKKYRMAAKGVLIMKWVADKQEE